MSSLTTTQKSLIKACVPILETHGEKITSLFYTTMLQAHPELCHIFSAANQTHMAQPRALAHALYAYAKHIDDPSVLSSTIERVANKHASLFVKPEHYPIVGKYLLDAMKMLLGDAFTPEILGAWTIAYGELADVFIARERGLYEEAGDWVDWRDFEIVKKVRENENGEIVSFWLKPVDGKPLPEFKPGQYVSIQVDVPALGHAQARQYSLSDAPAPDHYRITVKKEVSSSRDHAANFGLVSNLLHDTKEVGDTIRVSHPMGDFFLSSIQEESPVVLISAGVGLTGLTSMLNALITDHSKRPITWIHAAHTPAARAFSPHVHGLSRTKNNICAVFFDTVAQADIADKTYVGRLDLKVLDEEKELYLKDETTEYHVCGPTGFMIDVERGLRSYGVDHSRIRMELFGVGAMYVQ